MPGKDGDAELTPEDVLDDVNYRMDRTIDAFKRELGQLRTGRATPALIEDLSVDYYGSATPLKQIASISAPDARAIMVQPWDRGSLGRSNEVCSDRRWVSTPPTTETSLLSPYRR